MKLFKIFISLAFTIIILWVITFSYFYLKIQYQYCNKSISKWDIIYMGSGNDTPRAMLINKETGETYAYVAMANGWLKIIRNNNDKR